MKKLLIFLLIATIGCGEYPSPKVTTVKGTTPFGMNCIANHFDYNNHSYIEFQQGNATWGTHDPDCKCKK